MTSRRLLGELLTDTTTSPNLAILMATRSSCHDGRGSRREPVPFLQLRAGALKGAPFLCIVEPKLTFPTHSFAVLMGFDGGYNLFHFLEKALTYHAFERINAAEGQFFYGVFLMVPYHLLSQGVLPARLDSVFCLLPKPTPGHWVAEMMRRVLFPNTSLYWEDDLKMFTEQQPICFNQLFVPGTIIHLFLGPRG